MDDFQTARIINAKVSSGIGNREGSKRPGLEGAARLNRGAAHLVR